MIWPAPGADGLLSLMLSQSLGTQYQGLDGEVIPFIPTDFAPLLDYKTALLLMETQPEDSIYKVGVAYWTSNIYGDGRNESGLLADLKAFVANRDRANQSKLTAQTGRSGVMLGRR